MTSRHMSSLRPAIRSLGFSVVEVMVALFVITVGLLGVAKMQALALASTTSADERSMASFEAASLADLMHANRAYWSATPPVTIQVSISNGTVSYNSTSPSGFPAATVNCTPAADGGTAPCNPATLAEYDVEQWAAAVNLLLPNSLTTINCPQVTSGSPAPLSCTVQISWFENAVAINSAEAAAAAANATGSATTQFQNAQFANNTYTLYVDP
jgi:type IV pilus assembly protein PilV